MTSYCLRCLTPAHESQPACSRCAAPFEGAGCFDRIEGPPPSPEFAFLFSRAAAVCPFGTERVDEAHIGPS
jgi:hypothetical protein